MPDWNAIREHFGAYTKGDKDRDAWIQIAEKAKLDPPDIKGHGSGKAGTNQGDQHALGYLDQYIIGLKTELLKTFKPDPDDAKKLSYWKRKFNIA
jgi:hypothetical protein